MKLATCIFVEIIGLSTLLTIISLLRRQLLTIGLGVAWFVPIGGLMCLPIVPPLQRLFIAMSSSLFSSPPYVVALTLFLLVFLIYISVVLSKLQRQTREIAQFIALERAGNK